MRARDRDEVGRALLATGGGIIEIRLMDLTIWKRWKSSSVVVILVGIEGKVNR